MSQPQTCIQLPVLDISQPLDPSSLSSLAQACKEWGFFYITNHGFSKGVYTKLYTLSNQLFNLPIEAKSSVKTYTPHFIASPFFESLRVAGPDFFASARSSADVFEVEQQKSEFSKILQEYGNKMTEISEQIINIILMSLGEDLDTQLYEPEFKNCHGYFRINNYSPPKSIEEEVEGLGMHTDMSCITIVYQDDIGGLQVRSKDGKWNDISPCEGTLVVNIGDLLQAWSNNKLRSSEHRVVLKQQELNRFSLAFFWCFEDDKVIFAPDEVLGEGCSRVYDRFVCVDYLKFRESNEKGKFEKVGFTVKDFAAVVGSLEV